MRDNGFEYWLCSLLETKVVLRATLDLYNMGGSQALAMTASSNKIIIATYHVVEKRADVTYSVYGKGRTVEQAAKEMEVSSRFPRMWLAEKQVIVDINGQRLGRPYCLRSLMTFTKLLVLMERTPDPMINYKDWLVLFNRLNGYLEEQITSVDNAVLSVERLRS